MLPSERRASSLDEDAYCITAREDAVDHRRRRPYPSFLAGIFQYVRFLSAVALLVGVRIPSDSRLRPYFDTLSAKVCRPVVPRLDCLSHLHLDALHYMPFYSLRLPVEIVELVDSRRYLPFGFGLALTEEDIAVLPGSLRVVPIALV